MSAKLLFVLNWQIDSRIKPFPIKDFKPIETPYGTINLKQAPSENYLSSSTYASKVLYIDLNENEQTNFAKQIPMETLYISRVRLLFGYTGFLSVEVECDYRCKTFKDVAEQVATQSEKDLEDLASFVSLNENLEYYDKIVSYANDYLIRNKDFWFGTHKFIKKILDKENSDDSKWDDNYIYNYHTFVTDRTEAEYFVIGSHIKQKERVIEGCHAWLDFANYLWLNSNGFTIDQMEHLSFSSIPITWQNLIFDVGTINYKNILQMLTDGKKIPTEIIRHIVNRDNTLIMEIGLMLRGQTVDQNEITLLNQSEGLSDFRKDLFEKGQTNLLNAANGSDSTKQSNASKMMETILTILTAMSVYSVACDACSLLLMETESMSFHLFSSSIFVLATIVMMIIFILSKKKI